jgi:hypothetical protein
MRWCCGFLGQIARQVRGVCAFPGRFRGVRLGLCALINHSYKIIRRGKRKGRVTKPPRGNREGQSQSVLLLAAHLRSLNVIRADPLTVEDHIPQGVLVLLLGSLTQLDTRVGIPPWPVEVFCEPLVAALTQPIPLLF